MDKTKSHVQWKELFIKIWGEIDVMVNSKVFPSTYSSSVRVKRQNTSSLFFLDMKKTTVSNGEWKFCFMCCYFFCTYKMRSKGREWGKHESLEAIYGCAYLELCLLLSVFPQLLCFFSLITYYMPGTLQRLSLFLVGVRKSSLFKGSVVTPSDSTETGNQELNLTVHCKPLPPTPAS